MSMDTDSIAGVFPGGIRQFGFIVDDLDVAIEQWAALGVAPWMVVRDLPMQGCIYRGELSEPVISLALSNAGDMQVELIQQLDDTPSIYKEFLDSTGGGFNQVAYWVEDFDQVRGDALASGWTEVWSGDSGGTRFAYYEHPQSPVTIVEVMELGAASAPMGEMIRQAAAAWEPGQPIVMS
jgi:hypothetical protein